MSNIVEIIQKEIDNAHINLVERLEDQKAKISKEKEGLSNEDIDIFKKLKAFENIPIKAKVREIANKEIELDKESYSNVSLKNAIQAHKNLFPFNRFIDLTELYKILGKYDLFLGHESAYIGDIPIQNARKIIKFDEDLKNKSIREKSQDQYSPLCHKEKTKASNGITSYCDYYIVAPRSDFKNRGLIEIGNELVYQKKIKSIKNRIKEKKFEDPIVLKPLFLYDKILLTIVTKWGPEAICPEFQNPIEN